MKKPEEMSTRSLIHSLSRNKYNLWNMEYGITSREIIISRYDEVFKEFHKRGNCFILDNGAEELRKIIHYELPIKEKTIETLMAHEQNVLTLYFGLKGTAYCECKICEMLNLTPYNVHKYLQSSIRRLRVVSRKSLNDSADS